MIFETDQTEKKDINKLEVKSVKIKGKKMRVLKRAYRHMGHGEKV